MKTEIALTHRIEERLLEEIKRFYQPKTFMEYCKICEHYNKIWTCPPYDSDMENMLEGYRYVYIIGSKLYFNDVKESYRDLFDTEDSNHITNEIYKIARFVIDGRLEGMEGIKKDLRILLAGRCLTCHTCTREKKISCTYPDKMHYSLESIGFDVASICQMVLGEEIQWAKDSLPEYLILVSAILSKEKLRKEDLYAELTNNSKYSFLEDKEKNCR